MVVGNMISQTGGHGIYADGYATNLVVSDNKMIGLNTANTRGVFINLGNNDGLAANNDARGFPLGDYLGTGVTYGYQNKSVLKMKPDAAPAAVTGTSYFDNSSNKQLIYDGTTWHALW